MIKQKEIYATYPRAGGNVAVGAGVLVLDFLNGVVKGADVTPEKMTSSLRKFNRDYMRSMWVEADKDVKLRFDNGSWFTKDSGTPFFVTEFPFQVLEMELSETTNVRVVASTSFVGFTGGDGSKKKLDSIALPCWIIPLDFNELDITSTAGDEQYANRTISKDELYNDKDGGDGEIEKVELILQWGYKDDSGAVNYLECSDDTYNQHKIRIGGSGGTWQDTPFILHGGKTGQHEEGDCEVNANGPGSIMLMADISDLVDENGNAVKENIKTTFECILENAESLGDNLRSGFSTFLRITYKGAASS